MNKTGIQNPSNTNSRWGSTKMNLKKINEMRDRAIEFLRRKKFAEELIDHNLGLFYRLASSINVDKSASLAVDPQEIINLALYHNLQSVRQLPNDLQGKVGPILSKFIDLKKHDVLKDDHKWHYYSELSKSDLPLLIFRTVDVSMLPLQRDILIHLFGFDRRKVDEQMRCIAESMLFIYSQYATILGLHSIAVNLRNSSASVLYPALYARVIEEFEKKKDMLELTERSFGEEINNLVREALVSAGINFVLFDGYNYYKSRIKQPGSTVFKLAARNRGADEVMSLHDIVAFMVVTESTKEVYDFVDVVRDKFGDRIVEIDDSIKNQRQNGYQAIHIDFNFNGINVELQVKSHEMYERCERADLSHSLYKLTKLDLETVRRLEQYNNLLSDVTTEQILNVVLARHAPRIKVNVQLQSAGNVLVELPKDSCIFDLVCSVSDPPKYNDVSIPATGRKCSLFERIDEGLTYKLDEFPHREGPSNRTLRSLANVCTTQNARLAISNIIKRRKKENRRNGN